MDQTAPLASSSEIPLPPLPQRGTRSPAPTSADFRELLASQGVKPPADGKPMSETEARIAAAQIASKANVNASVKRDRQWSGMTQAPAAPVPAAAANSGRFLPLHAGPSAARLYTTPAVPAGETVTSLRAATKFAPGPVASPIAKNNTPAVAAAVKRAQENGVEPRVAVPEGADAYAYGLHAAAAGKQNQLPPWFSGAMSDAMDKYDSLKATPAH